MDTPAHNHAFITLFERKMDALKEDNPEGAQDVFMYLMKNINRIRKLIASEDKVEKAAGKRMLGLLMFEAKQEAAAAEQAKITKVAEGTGEQTKGNPEGEIECVSEDA